MLSSVVAQAEINAVDLTKNGRRRGIDPRPELGTLGRFDVGEDIVDGLLKKPGSRVEAE